MPDMLECNICTTPTMYRHLGGISCKACADFYRRSLMARRVYSCRKGDGKCTIDPKYRQICRGCRFEMCKRIGLRMTVMPRKDVDGPTVKIPKYTVLQRICSEYTTSVSRRKENESKLMRNALLGHVRTAVGKEELQLCSRSFLERYLKVFKEESFRFGIETFPDFAALSFHEQRLIIEKSTSLLYTVEMLSNTFMRFKSLNGPIYNITPSTYLDLRLYPIFAETEESCQTDESLLALKFYTERANCVVGKILSKSNFTPTEYAAVFALLLWQINPSHHLSERLVTLIFTNRQRIYVDLSIYYKQELGLRNYAERLCNLLTFEHAIQESIIVLKNRAEEENHD